MLIERMQHFVFPVAPNPTPSVGLSLRVDLDAPFRLFGIVVWNLGVPELTGVDGQIALRISRPDGRTIQRQLTATDQLFPGNQYNVTGTSPNKAWAAPIRPSVLYPAGSVIDMDILGLDTGIVAPTGLLIVFVGTNVYNQGEVWAPAYPPKWTPRPYLDNLTVQNVTVPGGLPKLNQPFTAQADSDFVWQTGVYSDVAVGTGSVQFAAEGTGLIKFVGQSGVTVILSDSTFGTPNTPLTVSVIGTTITITGATDGAGNESSTVAQAVALVNATTTLVTASQLTPGQFPAPASGVIPGGARLAVCQLVDLGVIVRDPAYKAYSNTYVPAALLFAFMGAQNPGWLYPEIYIPRLQQLYFDFAYLYPGFTPGSNPVTITLGLKGMKVYPQT